MKLFLSFYSSENSLVGIPVVGLGLLLIVCQSLYKGKRYILMGQ